MERDRGYVRYRGNGRRQAKFWLLVIGLCLLVGLVVVGIDRVLVLSGLMPPAHDERERAL